MSRSIRWCFTLNNFEETDEFHVQQLPSKYLIYGRETGANGTPHLQGFVIFDKRQRLAGVKKLIPRAHWEVTRGTSQQASDYCRKEDENPFESGTLENNSGKRNDLEDFKKAVKEGEHSIPVLRDSFSDVFAKYPRFCHDYVADNLPVPDVACHPLHPWQQTLNDSLKLPPDDRTVTFVVDYEGNKGKSWFAQYYCRHHDDCLLMRPTKHADMAYALPNKLRVLFLDCTRKQVEYLPYTFLEECKDGYVFSSKYESRMKSYGNMHIVVLLNQDPDMTALSADRYKIIKL